MTVLNDSKREDERITLYDKKRRRLVFVYRNATSSFWDDVWEVDDLRKALLSARFDALVTPTTKRFLRKGSRILEGGCGRGKYVKLLKEQGYDVVGVDYAKKTVEALNRALPDLDIRHGDVRRLEFGQDWFDGYWSLGVIEHFYAGYGDILDEMHRVVRPGGYVFVTFPHMSLSRKVRARLGLYKRAPSEQPKDFYQFALDRDEVVKRFRRRGFEVEGVSSYDGFTGLRQDNAIFRILTKPVATSKSFFARAIRYGLGALLRPWSGHIAVLVFRKKVS